MSEPSLAAQKLMMQKLRARPSLIDIIGNNIFDRHAVPEVFPCVLIGEAQVTGEDIGCSDLSTVFATVHVWTKETGMQVCKTIAGEVRRAMRGADEVVDGFALSSDFNDVKYLRDPSGEHAHGVMTFEILAEDLVSI